MSDNPKPTDDLQPHQTDFTPDDLFGWHPPSVERYVPGVGPTFVHGYTGVDAGKWRQAARNMARGAEPTPEQYAVAQVLWVCRTAPGGADHTFKVRLQDARRAFERMMEALPGTYMDQVCQLSDTLTMAPFVPPNDPQARLNHEAFEHLGAALSEPAFWTALSHLSLRLYGVPLTENDRPLGDVLSHVTHDLAAKQRLLDAIGPLVALLP